MPVGQAWPAETKAAALAAVRSSGIDEAVQTSGVPNVTLRRWCRESADPDLTAALTPAVRASDAARTVNAVARRARTLEERIETVLDSLVRYQAAIAEATAAMVDALDDSFDPSSVHSWRDATTGLDVITLAEDSPAWPSLQKLRALAVSPFSARDLEGIRSGLQRDLILLRKLADIDGSMSVTVVFKGIPTEDPRASDSVALTLPAAP